LLGRLSRHLGLFKHIGEFRFKGWLNRNASRVLSEAGVGRGQALLDFGCGSGTYAVPAAKLVGESGRVYALDVSGRALDRLEERARREGLTNIVRMDSSGEAEIRLDDKSLDHVLLINVLQEISDRGALFDEILRTLKPGGAVTVFPMHLAEDEVMRLAAGRGLHLEDRRFDGRILIFRKPSG